MNTCHVLKTLIPAAIIACLSGCTPGFDIDEFETADELGLIIKGKYVLRYDETNFQIGSNADKNIFWITDDDMADYFIVTCSSFPQAGDQVKADLTPKLHCALRARQAALPSVFSYICG